jgi:hypothetical protein
MENRYNSRMLSLAEFFAQGGMAAIERDAAARAIAEERTYWLHVLEGALPALRDDDTDLMAKIQVEAEIRRLRKLLSLPPPLFPQMLEHRRIKTRERVRRHRQRRRLKA